MHQNGLVDIIKGFTTIHDELKLNKLDWIQIYDNETALPIPTIATIA